ncbi:MAG: alpha/beta hydrolase, partial [Planctomycetota bacterium]
EFLDALPDIHGLSHRVIVTVTSSDEALKSASRLMGGGARIGQYHAGVSEEDKQAIRRLERLQIIDVSYGSEERGFDIVGHRYWFNHPWASSDVVLTIRTDFTPQQRGLERGAEPVLWYMPADYPQRLKTSLTELDLRSW